MQTFLECIEIITINLRIISTDYKVKKEVRKIEERMEKKT